MSLRRFSGWEPAETTVYEYDDTGRLVRSVTTREPEWDDEQRAWVLASAQLSSESCSGCGGWLPHTTDAAMEGRFVADPPYRCHRCEALTIKRKNIQTSNPEALVVWPVREKEA